MRIALLAVMAALMQGGCASQSPAPDSDRTPEQQAANRDFALKNGYRVSSRDGHTVYCKTWPVTTSRIRTRNICLTAQELDAQERHTRKDLETPNIAPMTPGIAH